MRNAASEIRDPSKQNHYRIEKLIAGSRLEGGARYMSGLDPGGTIRKRRPHAITREIQSHCRESKRLACHRPAVVWITRS